MVAVAEQDHEIGGQAVRRRRQARPVEGQAPGPDADELAQKVRQALAPRTQSATLVDFDETLWLRSSTEAYLAGARPRWIAVAIQRGLDVLRPWSVLPGDRKSFLYRDWLRVLTITVLLPWTLPLWRRRAPALAARWRNRELMLALEGAGPVCVVSFGFGPLVRPLLAEVLPGARLVVVSDILRGYRVRAQGKRVAVERVLGRDVLAGAVVVTDSRDDVDLLAACRTPLLLVWPTAR
jgi:hypothetical protein